MTNLVSIVEIMELHSSLECMKHKLRMQADICNT